MNQLLNLLIKKLIFEELRCENVHCDHHFLDDNNEECPDDSIRTASYVPEGACCPISSE